MHGLQLFGQRRSMYFFLLFPTLFKNTLVCCKLLKCKFFFFRRFEESTETLKKENVIIKTELGK